MSEELKVCRLCNLELRMKSFNKFSHQCKKCLYLKNKQYHINYYNANKDRLKKHQLDLYYTVYKQEKEAEERKPRGRPKKYAQEKNI